jgi:hypothetical protein
VPEPNPHQQVTWNSPITAPLTRFQLAMASGVGARKTCTFFAAKKSAASGMMGRPDPAG